MAVAVRTCLGVDIGTNSIRIAHLEMGKAGPRILGLFEQRLQLDPGMTESQRNQKIAKQVQDMLKAGKVRTKNAVFCVPGQTVFVRRIKLPASTPERMNRMVRFEARQQIPFPLDKTIMEYQVFEDPESTEANVLLVAIKRDYITSFMRMVQRTGLRPLGISVSSLALYNFHELNSSTRDFIQQKAKKVAKPAKPAKGAKGKGGKDAKDAKDAKAPENGKPAGKSLFSFALKKKTNKNGAPEAAGSAVAVIEDEAPLDDMGFEEIQAYVNIGASVIDMAIPKTGSERMIGFTRSIPLAGNEMDRVIREKLNTETLEEARTLKEQQCAVLATEFEIDGDTDSVNMPASEAVTAVADRMISELRRTLDFYISQPDGVAVDRIVLTGGLARLRYLSNYIEEKMGLPVELAALKNPNFKPSERLPESFPPFIVSIGLALQGLQIAQNKIDFLPQDIKNIRSLQGRKLELSAMTVLLALIIFMNMGIGNSSVQNIKAAIESYKQGMNQKAKLSTEVRRAKDRRSKVDASYQKMAQAAGNRDFWFKFLVVFLAKRPPDVLIDRLILMPDGTVKVSGVTQIQTGVVQFSEELEAEKDLIKSVNLEKVGINPELDPRFPQAVYSFNMVIKTLVRKGRVRIIPRPTADELKKQQEKEEAQAK